MIEPSQFLALLQSLGVRFFTGVPDSLLQEFCLCIDRELPQRQHVIASNEGAAIATATGYHLATGTLPVVYMQNSGLGNAINPLVSLASQQVYSIPLLLLVGWRAELDRDGKQVRDEPQHTHQGAITLRLLDVLGIDYCVIGADTPDHEVMIASLVEQAKAAQKPAAIVIRRNTFAALEKKRADGTGWTREAALSACLDHLPANAMTVTTTGMASRELFELRRQRGQSHASDFLTVGAMGHASSIAYGISLAKSDAPVVCFDGDGALLMHMGTLPFCARQSNFKHIVINNGAHDSVGGQPTIANDLSLAGFASAAGYAHSATVKSEAELRDILDRFLNSDGSAFIEICCSKGSRPNLGRPSTSPSNNKRDFMRFLSNGASRQDEQLSLAK